MTGIQSLLLGTLQGVAEFLPISSSGHLLLLRQLMDLGEVPLLYDVLLHVSTLIVVIIVFRGRIGSIFASIWRALKATAGPGDRENRRTCSVPLRRTFLQPTPARVPAVSGDRRFSSLFPDS
jgi:undecaprenyl-diphosphatase